MDNAKQKSPIPLDPSTPVGHPQGERIALAQPVFRGKEKEYVNRCIDTGWISSVGEFVSKFEKEFAAYCGTKHGIACANGTVAIHMALLAKNIGPGDEIIIPNLTYIATANAVMYCGATPVFVECDEQTWNIDVKKIEEKITPRTKGIMPVHLYGLPAEMDEIMAIAKRHNLFVLEDAAQSHGATYRGKRTGSFGELATFSFFGNKVITCGEGGMVMTNDDALADRMRLLRNQGMSPKRRYWFETVGFNYRITNTQAAIGLAQLECIDWHIAQRKANAAHYTKRLSELSQYIQLPYSASHLENIFWLYTIVLKEDVQMERDELMKLLDQDGIETRPMFYPITNLPPYEAFRGNYPITEKVAGRGMNLPSHAALKTQSIDYIAERLKFHLTKKRK